MNSLASCSALWRVVALTLVASLAVSVSSVRAETPDCAVPGVETADTLFSEWNAALKTQHPDRMARLFANDGALRGFASPIDRSGYMPIRDYFLYFLQFEPKARVTARTVEAGCNFLIDEGTYVWTLKSRTTGVVETREARYRFIYEMSGGRWRLSQFVDELAPGTQAAAFSVPPPTTPRIGIVTAPSGTAVAGFVRRLPAAVGPSSATRINMQQKAPLGADVESDRRGSSTRPKNRRPPQMLDATEPFPTVEQLYLK